MNPTIIMPGASSVKLLAADQFSIRELTQIYNQTRADYLVPMQMSAAQMQHYIKVYDIDLSHSVVASTEGGYCGLGMLGVRPGMAWITRLGIVPASRCDGIGILMTDYLLENAWNSGVSQVRLEVIRGNLPALRLFEKAGFKPLRKLLVLKRTPAAPSNQFEGEYKWLENKDALRLMTNWGGQPPWTNQLHTYQHTNDVQGLVYDLGGDLRGWLIFRCRSDTLSHFIIQTENGNPANVAEALLSCLHLSFPSLQARVENIAAVDPHLPAFIRLGYEEKFQRIELVNICINTPKAEEFKLKAYA